MNKPRKLFTTVAAIAAALSLALVGCGGDSGGSAGGGDVTKLRLGQVDANGSVRHQAAEMFADKVREATDGALDIQVFPAGQIGSDESLGQDLSKGDLDFAFINQGSMAGMDQMLDFHYLPYIAQNYAQADELFYGDGIIPQTMTDTLAKHNIRAIGWLENEFRGLSNSKEDITDPAQIDGMKLRVPGSAAIKTYFEVLGAQAVTVPMPELYTALQQGTVDGQDNGLLITYDNKLHEANQHYTWTRHVYASSTIAASETTWQKFTPEQQEAITKAAEEVQEWQIAEQRKLTDSYIQKFKDEGVTFTELTEDQMAAFADAGADVWTQMEAVYGKDNIDALRAEMDAVKDLK